MTLFGNGRTAEADRRTALHAACFAGHTGCVRLLLDAGADIESRMRGGVTPLIAATQTGQSESVRLLIAARADLKVLVRHCKQEVALLPGHFPEAKPSLVPPSLNQSHLNLSHPKPHHHH